MTNHIEWFKAKHDTNGNPRYVCHYLNLLTTAEKANNYLTFDGLYDFALKRAKKIGGRKFHNKQYGGGIVFRTDSTTETEQAIERVRGEPFKTVNPATRFCTTEISDEQIKKFGQALVKVFGLKRLAGFDEPMFLLQNGYLSKTYEGVGNAVLRELQLACEVKS